MTQSVFPTIAILVIVVFILVVVIIFTIRGYPKCPAIPACPANSCPTIPACPAAPACNCPALPGGVGANCVIDSSCTSGLKCTLGTCQIYGATGGVCTTDGDCFSGLVCESGVCRPPGGISDACAENADCASGLSCVTGQCVCAQLPIPAVLPFTSGGPGGGFTFNWGVVSGATGYTVSIVGNAFNFASVGYGATSVSTGPIASGQSYVCSVSAESLNCGNSKMSTTVVVSP
jgi:hypothetical protein